MLLRLLTAVLETSILLHIANVVCPATRRRVVVDHSEVTASYLLY